MSPLDASSPNQRWLAKEFANSLEQAHRSTRHDVHGYVEFAKHLGETDGPEPDPDFRAALRHRLLHELIEDELVMAHDELALRRQERTVRRKGGSHCFERAPREPWIAAASTVLVVCGGAVGLGQESSQALPGDVLYPVKRFFESGEMTIANSSGGQARELMEQASERLVEARELATVDEIHAQQALPETLIDFNEATAEAGEIVVSQTRTGASDATLVSEFRSFASSSRAQLDELAKMVDSETMELIDDARDTLDSLDQLLPILDPVTDGVSQVPMALETLNVPGLGGHHHGDGVSETSVNPPDAEVEGILDDTDVVPRIDAVVPKLNKVMSGIDDTLNSTLNNATSTLASTVSVIELSTTDTVSMAVATVHNAANTVNHTVRQATGAIQDTVDQTVKSLDQTVQQALGPAQQTLNQITAPSGQPTAPAVKGPQQTVQQATDTVKQATDTVQQTVKQATDTVQQTVQQTTDTVQQTVQQTTQTVQQGVDDTVQQTLQTLQSTNGNDSAPTGADEAPGLDEAPDLDRAPGLDEAPGLDKAPGLDDVASDTLAALQGSGSGSGSLL